MMKSVVLLVLAIALSCAQVQAQPQGSIRVGSFVTREHELQGDVFAVDQRTFVITNMIYDGLGPAAFFWVGTGNTPNSRGSAVPFVPDCGTMVLPEKRGDTVTVELPPGLTINDIDYLSVWCELAVQNFGEVLISDAVKAQIPDPTGAPQCQQGGTYPVQAEWNCEMLSTFFQVRWKNSGANINFELVGKVTPEQWMSFGVSGSQTRTNMDQSDVAIATDSGGTPRVVDYFMNDRSQCSQGRGVCADTTQNGRDDYTGVSGERNKDTLRVTYTRPAAASEPTDLSFSTTPGNSTFLVWAIGPYNAEADVPQIHRRSEFTLPSGDVSFEFGRPVANKCITPIIAEEIREETFKEPFKRPTISNVTDFTMRIGPAGGESGVRAITQGDSWGIAWWVAPTNDQETDVLIPTIAVERGKTYTFRVFGGDDPNGTFHPLYITNDRDGGLRTKTPQSRLRETIYAGVNILSQNESGIFDFEPTATGPLCQYTGPSGTNETDYATYLSRLNRNCTQTVPLNRGGELVWTVPANFSEEVVYYQCLTHRDLGYKLVVFNEGEVDQKRLDKESVVTSAKAVTSACTAIFKGEAVTFNACTDFGPNFRVLYNVEGENIETQFEATAEGWAGLGYGTSSMTPADSVIAYKKDNQVVVSDYVLDSKSSDGVTVGNTQSITDAEGEMQGDRIVARFTRPLNAGRNPLQPDSKVNVIWAVGPNSPGAPSLRAHAPGDRGFGEVDLAARGASESSPVGGGRAYFVAHGVLMAIAWVVLSPIAVLEMRFFKKFNPATFQLHRGLNAVAVLAGVISFIMAVIRGSRTNMDHLVIGCIVTVLAVIQVVGGAARPHKDTPLRKPWFLSHAWVGRVALVLAWANVYIGLKLFQAGISWTIAVSVLLGVFVAVFILLSLFPNKFPITEEEQKPDNEPGEDDASASGKM